MTYNGKVYKFYPAVELSEHQDTSFFTEDDIDLLIFLRDELDIEAFPFNKSNGEITYLFLNKNWLFDVAIKLLYILKSSRMFNIVGSTLYIDGVEFDYKSRCSFGICEYGEYSYGITEVDVHRCFYHQQLILDVSLGISRVISQCYLYQKIMAEYTLIIVIVSMRSFFQ